MTMARRALILEESTRWDLSHLYTTDFFVAALFQQGQLGGVSGPSSVSKIARRLEAVGFDPEEDFIIMTGATNGLSFLLFVLGTLTDTLKVLVFDARESRYIEQTLDLSNYHLQENE